jgi:hypothetical protein
VEVNEPLAFQASSVATMQRMTKAARAINERIRH